MGEGTMEGKLGVALSWVAVLAVVGGLGWLLWSGLRDRLVRPVVLWLGTVRD